MKNRFKKWSALCVVGAALLASAPARVWAHGGVDDEKPNPAAAATAPTTSNATQTELEVHLEDLNQSAAGTSGTLVGAKVRGFLKHDDGDLLSRVTAVPEKTPGYYLIRFAEDAPNYHFSEAGHYLLELHVSPAKGEAFDTTVPFELRKTAPPAAPFWRRILPFALGALVLAIAGLFLKKRVSRRGSGSGQTRQKTPAPETVTVALFASLWPGFAWAGKSPGRMAAWTTKNLHRQPLRLPTPLLASLWVNRAQRRRRVRVRCALPLSRATLAPLDVLAPGEVKLPAQTALLLGLKTEPVGVAQLTTGISISGQIAPNPGSLVRVASLVPGRITRLNVVQGERVTRGQVVAIVESRAVGEAQSAYAQAAARLQNARSNLNVVQQQARAGVFSDAPLEVARRAQAEAAGYKPANVSVKAGQEVHMTFVSKGEGCGNNIVIPSLNKSVTLKTGADFVGDGQYSAHLDVVQRRKNRPFDAANARRLGGSSAFVIRSGRGAGHQHRRRTQAASSAHRPAEIAAIRRVASSGERGGSKKQRQHHERLD